MDKKVEQVLLGSLCGDGCIYKHNSNQKYPWYVEGHATKQKEYLLWKYNLLKNFLKLKILYTNYFYKPCNKYSKQIRITSNCDKKLKPYVKQMSKDIQYKLGIDEERIVSQIKYKKEYGLNYYQQFTKISYAIT